MAQDIKDLLKDYQGPKNEKLSNDHEALFEAKLEQAFSQESTSRKGMFLWMKVAASVILLLSVGYFAFKQIPPGTDPLENNLVVENNQKEAPLLTIGDLSPDLKKVEDFYVNGINIQLASLERTPENEELINGYLEKLEELNQAYQTLTQEMNTDGPSEATINALIDNLQLRLELLFKLKNKLQQLKELENENISDTTV